MIVLQRYKIKIRKSSFSGYIFQLFSLVKAVFQNIKMSEENREGDADIRGLVGWSVYFSHPLEFENLSIYNIYYI